jgi:formylglycine-generating enzyme required for sulfatase activity
MLLTLTLLWPQGREKRVERVPPQETQQFDRQRRAGVAVLVGVGTYPPFSGFNELKYPASDVDKLKAELEKQRYLVIVLKDGDATRQTVLNAIEQSGAAAQRSGGTMIFFFSGHGFEDRGANYLALHDAAANRLAESGLAVASVERAMRDAGVERRVLWMDACRNEPTKGGGGRSFAKFEAAKGTRMLFSTSAGGVSYEDDGLRQGLFTHYLLEGLGGKATGPDGWITFRDLTDFVIDGVEARSLQRGRPQVPYESGEARGDFLLGKGVAGVETVSVPVVVDRGPRRGEERVNPKDGQKYVWIPPGKFRMGCSPGDGECFDDEKPAHEVEITKGFWMGQTAVTVGAWKKYRSATGSAALADKDNLGRKLNEAAGNDRAPAVAMTWEEGKSYCEWAGMRLITEAEYELAARAGTEGSRYGSVDEIAWYGDNSGNQRIDSAAIWRDDQKNYVQRLFDNGNGPKPVGLKSPNANNLYDILGNVYTWTADWYGEKYYAASPQTNPAGPPSGDKRVVRGGSWNGSTRDVRASDRSWFDPSFRIYIIGVRCGGELR